jgi:hypothetical protein
VRSSLAPFATQAAAVAARLGHKHSNITIERYTKAFDDARAKAAATAGALLDEALAWQPPRLQAVK